MSGSADRLRGLTAAVAQRDAAAAAEDLDAAPVIARPDEMIRWTGDFDLDEDLEIRQWILGAAAAGGGGRIHQNDVVCAALLAAVRDEHVGRRVRALLAKMPPRRTKPKRPRATA